MSDIPRVYTKAEVEKWREMFANDRYSMMRFKAASRGGYVTQCAKQLEEAWDQTIKPCGTGELADLRKNFVPPV